MGDYFLKYKMLGATTRALTFKNVDGSCLLDCTINSLLNSYVIVKKLYELTPTTTSLSHSFSSILSEISSASSNIVYKYLLSAFVHDYINNIRKVDKRKILFIMTKHHDEESIDISALDEEYEHAQINDRFDEFIGNCGNISSRKLITTSEACSLSQNLNNTLMYFKDIYIVLTFRRNEFENVLNLNKDEINVAKKLIKSAITSTGDYICTDMILYKGNDEEYIEYSHVVYYNLLDNTLIDNHERRAVPLSDIVMPKEAHDYVSYIESKGSHVVYVPCVLHYQKINNDPKALGLVGKLDKYESHRNERIDFIKEQLATYTEEWYVEKKNYYLQHLL